MNRDFSKSAELKWVPDGFHFLGPEESIRRRKTLGMIHNFFQQKGFAEVKPPGFDFTSTFYDTMSEEERAKVFYSRDLLGKEISPSADLTVQVVKGMASILEKKISAKVYYTGKVVKDHLGNFGARREILQAGAEVLGHSNGNTFKLLLSLVDEIAIEMGLTSKITLVLGNTRVVNKIADKAKLSSFDLSELSRLLFSKNLPALRNFLKEKGIKREFTSILEFLVLEFSVETLLPLLEEFSIKHKLKLEECFHETRELYNYAAKLKNLDICIDYSLVPDLEYYTGFIFHGYIQNSTVFMGGAYDTLFEKFSRDSKRACGFAIDIDLLEEHKTRI
ncbi:MAG: ATP phosphoribosyltransferase regulatory subunit [Leptospiraceae bacterium]|nr:ATP phosphoribosyltransferase regulatory subunit [Leptospiraceae bacterium]